MITIIRDRISASAQPEVLLIYFSALTLPLVDTAGSMDTLYTCTYKLSSGVTPHNFGLKKINSDKPLGDVLMCVLLNHLLIFLILFSQTPHSRAPRCCWRQRKSGRASVSSTIR